MNIFLSKNLLEISDFSDLIILNKTSLDTLKKLITKEVHSGIEKITIFEVASSDSIQEVKRILESNPYAANYSDADGVSSIKSFGKI